MTDESPVIGSDGAPGASARGNRRFLTFRVAGTTLAVPLAAAQEIARPPEVVPIPLAPPGLQGLARRHGKVLPVLALRRIFGQPDGERAASARMVVVDHRGQAVGLAVDGVGGVQAIEEARIDTGTADAVEEAGRGIDPTFLAGALRGPDGAVAALILATDSLIERQFIGVSDAGAGSGRGAEFRPGAASAPRSAPEHEGAILVSFDVAGQEFALPVAQVERIVPLTGTVARMPNARSHLLGVVADGDGLLPLIGLRALFGLEGAGDEHGVRVVIAAPRPGERVGLVVDGVSEILRPETSAIGAVPAILAREPEFADLDGILRLDGGRRLVSILSAERMLAHTAALAAAVGNGGAGTDGEGTGMDGDTARGARDATEAYVVFRIGSGEYALPVDAVREALRRPDVLAPLPKAPEFVAGLVNLRGNALPVLDLARILRLPEATGRAVRPRIVVVGLGVTRVGLAVDGVTGVMRIPASAIEPAPAVSVAQRHLIRRVAHLDDGRRMILLLEIDALLDIDQLSAVIEAI